MCNATHTLKSNRFTLIIPWLAATILFAFLAIYETRPIAWHLRDSTYYDYGDGLLNAWILRWNLHQLVTHPSQLFHASMFYPSKYSLALSENMLGLSLLYWPIDLFFKDTL